MVRRVGAAVLAAAAIGSALLVANFVFSVYHTRQLRDESAAVVGSSELLLALDNVLSLAVDAETGQRGYVITGRDEYLAPYRAAVASIHRQMDALEQLVDRRMPDEEKRVRREFEEHWFRWEAVTELYQRRLELLAHGDDRGKSLEKCYNAIAENTGDSYKAVKESYRLIRRAGGEHVTLESYKRERTKKSRAAKLRILKNT